LELQVTGLLLSQEEGLLLAWREELMAQEQRGLRLNHQPQMDGGKPPTAKL